MPENKEMKKMPKRLTVLAAFALLLALAAIVPGPAIHAADRTYTLCDPKKSIMCSGLVALYEFEETSDYARTSETGSASWVEPDGANVARTSTHLLGTYALNLAAGDYLQMKNTPSLDGEFTINIWVYFVNDTTDGYGLLWTTPVVPRDYTAKGSYLAWSMPGSSVNKCTYAMKSADGLVSAAWGTDMANSQWHLISFGQYASPTTTAPRQWTNWISVDAGTKITNTADLGPKSYLGDLILGSATALYVDQMSVYAKTLTAGELTWLYNSRSGRAYPFTANP